MIVVFKGNRRLREQFFGAKPLKKYEYIPEAKRGVAVDGLIEVEVRCEEVSCSICLDDLEHPVVQCRKGHQLHLKCYKEWVAQNNDMCIFRCNSRYEMVGVQPLVVPEVGMVGVLLSEEERKEFAGCEKLKSKRALKGQLITYKHLVWLVESRVFKVDEYMWIETDSLANEKVWYRLMEIFFLYYEAYRAFKLQIFDELQPAMQMRGVLRTVANLKLLGENVQYSFFCWLVREGVDLLSSPTYKDCSALCYIFRYMEPQYFEFVVKLKPECLDALDYNGRRLATYVCSVEELERLRQCGVNILQIDEEGNSLLHYAQDPKVIALLVGEGLDVNGMNVVGLSPLYWNCGRGAKRAQQLILSGALALPLDQLNREIMGALATEPDILDDVLMYGQHFFHGLSKESMGYLMELCLEKRLDEAVVLLQNVYGIVVDGEMLAANEQLLRKVCRSGALDILRQYVCGESNVELRKVLVREVLRGESLGQRMLVDIYNYLMHNDLPIDFVIDDLVEYVQAHDVPLRWFLQGHGSLKEEKVLELLKKGDVGVLKGLLQCKQVQMAHIAYLQRNGYKHTITELLAALRPEDNVELIAEWMEVAAVDGSNGIFNTLFNKFNNGFFEQPFAKGLVAKLKKLDNAAYRYIQMFSTFERREVDRLCAVVKRGDLVELEKLVVECAQVLNEEGSDGWTPLCLAICNGKVDCVKKLLAGGAKVNVKSKNMPPLQCAFMFMNEEIIGILVEAGANLHYRDVYGNSFYYYCRGVNGGRMRRLLEEHEVKE